MKIPENYFIFINIFIIALYIVLMLIGYHKGFLFETVNLIYTLLSLALAWFAAPVLGKLFPIIHLSESSPELNLLNQYININESLNTVCYFIIIFLLLKVLYIFVSLMMKSLNKIPVFGDVNQFFGAIFGFINASIIIVAISMLLSLPIIRNGKEVKEGTILKYIDRYSKGLLSTVIEKAGDLHLSENLNKLDIENYRQQLSEWLEKLNSNE